jgi:site-specific recombinase XerD
MSGTRRKPGLMGPYVEGYRVRLLELGYTPDTVRNELKVLGQLGRWMANRHIGPEQLDGPAVTDFIAMRRSEGFKRVGTLRSIGKLLTYLQASGVSVARPRPPATELDVLLGEYEQWLMAKRAVAPRTVLRYSALARKFLAARVSTSDALGVTGLNGKVVARFLLDECARLSLGSAKGRVTELRSLLRFLHLKGLTQLSLGESVPPVAGWRDTAVPRTVPSGDVERLLASCQRSALPGCRDFAMLMLLARLGLRSAEVAWLELDDIDWRCGEVTVRGKGHRQDRLPLPADVGAALAAYLSMRGNVPSRRVFVTLRPPRRPVRADLLGDVVQRACVRAGVAHIGPHRLRHTLATEMLRQGASLVDIGQVLRHRDLATTAVYAKVDLGRLRQVARPWPGAGQ